jgi:uncharacterized protein
MSHRLQVLIPETLNARLSKAAQRSRLSRGEWVRGAIEKALAEVTTSDPLAKLSSLGAPTADIEQMLLKVFVDSNIPMYVAGRAHENREPALRFLDSIRRGEREACTSTEVLQEVLYRYSALKRFDLAKDVYDLFTQICVEILPVTLADTDRAKSMVCAKNAGLGVRDAIHAAVMLNNNVAQIATFDQGFDRIKGIKRLPLT